MFLIAAIIIVGASGIVAQVLLLRELLVSFYGNELTIGVVLAGWVFAEALGVFLTGKLAAWSKNKLCVFLSLVIIFSLSLPAALYGARTFKSAIGIPFGEVPGLFTVMLGSLSVVAAVAFTHGGLFSASCELYSLTGKKPHAALGHVYGWEALGTLLGSIVLTCYFIPFLNSFQSAALIACALLIGCIPLTSGLISKSSKAGFCALFVVCASLMIFVLPGPLQRKSLRVQWKPLEVLESRTSVFGTITVTQEANQRVFYYNGLPLITLPFPDIVYTQEFGHLPLLFHPHPRDLLVISGAAGGTLSQILQHPLDSVDYAELDPLIFTLLNRYPSALTTKELKDPRLKMILADGRRFLKTTQKTYDVLLLGLSKPTDLSTNRFFTREFFSLAAKRLNKEGVFAFCLPGSLTYISPAVRNLNASILASLEDVFRFVRVIPGDYNLILASCDAGLMSQGAAALYQRLQDRHIQSSLFVPGYLEYRLSAQWTEWFESAFKGAKVRRNTDMVPYALFQMEILWNRQYSSTLAQLISIAGALNIPMIIGFFLALTLCMVIRMRQLKRLKTLFPVVYCVATTGFFGMLINLILIFSYQVNFGYLYHRIGLLIGIFTAGTALGSFFAAKRLRQTADSLGLLIAIESLIVVFLCFAGLALAGLQSLPLREASLLYVGLFLGAGLLLGLEFSVASMFLNIDRQGAGATAGILYGADLAGGWGAGMLGAVILLPVLGIGGSCVLLGIMKLSSTVVLMFRKILG